jgi:hypothetical protein
MVRGLYRCLVWLHPAPFRLQFAEEMVWIFDEAAGKWGRRHSLLTPVSRSAGSGSYAQGSGNGPWLASREWCRSLLPSEASYRGTSLCVVSP